MYEYIKEIYNTKKLKSTDSYGYSNQFLMSNELYEMYIDEFKKYNININNIYNIINSKAIYNYHFNEVFMYLFYNNIEKFIEKNMIKEIDIQYFNNMLLNDKYKITNDEIKPIDAINKYLHSKSLKEYNVDDLIKEYNDSGNKSYLKYDDNNYLYNPTRFVLGGNKNKNENKILYILMIILIIIVIILIIIKVKNHLKINKFAFSKLKLNFSKK